MRDEPGTEFDDFVLESSPRLATLTRRERTVIVLRYFAQLSEAEIAAELCVPPGTVKSTAHRALGKLRASPHLHPAGEEATR